jgi:hypothetical protein
MRKMETVNWMVRNVEGKEEKENIVRLLFVLLHNKRPEEIPRGLEKFRLMSRVGEAFEKADETNILELEDGDYLFLKDMVEKDIPSVWAMNSKLATQVEKFLALEKEK